MPVLREKKVSIAWQTQVRVDIGFCVQKQKCILRAKHQIHNLGEERYPAYLSSQALGIAFFFFFRKVECGSLQDIVSNRQLRKGIFLRFYTWLDLLVNPIARWCDIERFGWGQKTVFFTISSSVQQGKTTVLISHCLTQRQFSALIQGPLYNLIALVCSPSSGAVPVLGKSQEKLLKGQKKKKKRGENHPILQSTSLRAMPV